MAAAKTGEIVAVVMLSALSVASDEVAGTTGATCTTGAAPVVMTLLKVEVVDMPSMLTAVIAKL